MSECIDDGCNKNGFIEISIDGRMLCVEHFNECIDISYLNEPENENHNE